MILGRNQLALKQLETLQRDFTHLINEEIALNIAFNISLWELYFSSNYSKAIDNSMATLDRFKNSDNKYMLAMHLKMAGHCYAHTGEADLAERYLLEALETLSTDPEYCAIRADILHELAMTTEYRDATSEQIKDYLLSAIELLYGEKHKVRKANCLMGLGNYYNNINEMLLALEYYKQAAETFEQKNVVSNMGNCYSNMGSCYLKLRDYAEAQKYLDKALELRLQSGSPEQLGISWFNLGVLYKERREFALADEMLLKALHIVEQLGNKHFADHINQTIHQLELEKNKEKRMRSSYLFK